MVPRTPNTLCQVAFHSRGEPRALGDGDGRLGGEVWGALLIQAAGNPLSVGRHNERLAFGVGGESGVQEGRALVSTLPGLAMRPEQTATGFCEPQFTYLSMLSMGGGRGETQLGGRTLAWLNHRRAWDTNVPGPACPAHSDE